MSKYQKSLLYLEKLQKFGIKLGLEQTFELMEAVGSPHKKLKFIHIAGSNGKGSCGAMLNACLKEEGFTTGFYSSPHLISPRERFRINGKAICEDEFAELVFSLEPHAEKMATAGRCPTYFEFTTTMAALCFMRNKIDFVIWETGMGGRFDSTNVVDPVCSVITGISLDHQQYLGDSIEKIAFEKAGIIKDNKPVILGKMPETAKNVIYEQAQLHNSEILNYAQQDIKHLKFDKEDAVWLQHFDFDNCHVELSLPGAMQRENFRTVFSVLSYLSDKFCFSLKKSLAGLSKSKWPARCQILPGGIIIDGGHNIDGIKVLIKSLEEFIHDTKLPIIFGGFKDKDTLECIKLLEPLAEYFIFLQLSTEFRPSWSGEELKAISQDISSKKIYIADTPEHALELCQSSPIRLICGSLYLAGEFLYLLVSEDELLNI